MASMGINSAFGAMPQEGADTPKLSMVISSTPTEAEARRVKQIGINVVEISYMPPTPWTDDTFDKIKSVLKPQGLTLGIAMLPWRNRDGSPSPMQKIVNGSPGRDEEIAKVKESLRAAKRAGLPVVEYNFYPRRASEGYRKEPGRGGSVMSGFDYERMKGLAAQPSDVAHKHEDVWANLAYFLKEIVPVAESLGVRLALHANDPPVPISGRSEQIMNSLADWKRLIETVPSPSNGITFDCGVTRELGEDPVAVCRYFASRDRINHMHFRNVKMSVPRLKYVEVFPDEGDNDMFAVMRELIKNKYARLIKPEHPMGLDVDRDGNVGSFTGWTYNVAYARAMLQAALLQR